MFLNEAKINHQAETYKALPAGERKKNYVYDEADPQLIFTKLIPYKIFSLFYSYTSFWMFTFQS
jgi:hypothetical protein